MVQEAVFYYPVQREGDDDVLIFYVRETRKVWQVSFLFDPSTLEAETFATMPDAEAFCRALNARQRALPKRLNELALRFLFAHVGRLRYHEQNGRRFLIVPIEACV